MTNDNYGAADPAVYSSLIKNNLLLLLSDLHWEVRRKVWGLEPPARIASSALVHLDLAVRARNGGRVATERARDLRRGAGCARDWRDGAPGVATPLQELCRVARAAAGGCARSAARRRGTSTRRSVGRPCQRTKIAGIDARHQAGVRDAQTKPGFCRNPTRPLLRQPRLVQRVGVPTAALIAQLLVIRGEGAHELRVSMAAALLLCIRSLILFSRSHGRMAYC